MVHNRDYRSILRGLTDQINVGQALLCEWETALDGPSSHGAIRINMQSLAKLNRKLLADYIAVLEEQNEQR